MTVTVCDDNMPVRYGFIKLLFLLIFILGSVLPNYSETLKIRLLQTRQVFQHLDLANFVFFLYTRDTLQKRQPCAQMKIENLTDLITSL